MKACLSPFGNIVDRALREALPGIRLSSNLVRTAAISIRTSLIAYLRKHPELTIQGFGTFRRKFRTYHTFSGTKQEPYIEFAAQKSLEEGDGNDG